MDFTTAPDPAGAELLDHAHTTLTRYCVLPFPEAADAIVLWIAATHALPSLPAATRLVVTSAVKRSGKTRVLDIVEGMVHQPLVSMNASVAAIFRSLGHAHPPTLIFDEIDTIFGSVRVAEQNEDLRGLINAGFQRGKPTLRCVGPKQQPTFFPTFAMCAMAGIGGVPETIRDRAVNIRMRRRKAGETAAPFRERRDRPGLHKVRNALEKWLGQPALRQILDHAEPATDLEDRSADLWEPLLMIADLAGGDWPQRARNAAKKFTADADGDEDDTEAVRLLHDIENILALMQGDFIPTEILLLHLRKIEEAPWATADLNAHGVAKLLKQFSIASTRDATGSKRGYKRGAFADAFERYPQTVPDEP